MVGGLVSATVFQMLSSIMVATATTSSLADAASVGRTAIDTMADHLRNGAGCGDSTKGVYGSVLATGTATAFSYYSDSTTCATVSYSLSSGNLIRTVGTTTTILARDVTSISFTYTYADQSTNPVTLYTTTAPTTAQLPLVYAVTMVVVTNSGGLANTLQSSVRLRNITNPDDGS